MKKIIALSVIVIFVTCGWNAAAIDPEESLENTMILKTNTLSLPCSTQPVILERAEAVVIELKEMTSQLMEPNKPVLPIIVKTFPIPYGSKDIQVTCVPTDINTMILTKKIMAACITPLSKINARQTNVRDEAVYNSTVFYPQSWYRSTISAGVDTNGDRILIVKIVCYPVRYSPVNNQIEYTTSFDIGLTYAEPVATAQTNETYDLVIIAPAAFKEKLQPLIDFKNSKGLKTTFKAVEDILDHYTGADPPEQVKYFIKDAYDSWGIHYVLLVGGLKSHFYANDKDTPSAGWKAWWVPVRYVNIPQDEDEGCLSDLYYGCLYNSTGGFDSWDSNGDGIYAAWNAPGAEKDTFDLYPEVHVGRLPVSNKREVANMVKKIITYESTSPDEKPWYKNFIGIGGKTFGYYQGQPDGEYLCNLTYNYAKQAIPDLTLIPVYTTNKNTSGFVPITKDIQKAISQGAGYVDFEGHGSPLAWDTIWFDGTYPKDWCGGINLYNFLKLSNGEKLPIVVVGGCHNGLYNVSLLKTMRDKTGSQYFTYGVPLPACFSWGLVVKYPGGAIASTGCTGFGMGYQGNPVSLSAELEANFFYQIGNGSTNLGQAYSGAIQKFLDEEEINQVEAFVITNWALFGDPSLRLGGYP
ncbi:MAG: C25 family cysteine peptidase [Euryarchaeota archaeon]|nr:C25 family cysteine peptidase [Euryarchaeota archaeon]